MSTIIRTFILALLLGVISIGSSIIAAADDDIQIPDLLLIERNAPEPGETINTFGQYVENFSWDDVDGAEWYHVVVVKGTQFQFDKWYEASDVCAEGVCITSHEVWLSGSGEFDWWMTYWNEEVGADYVDLYEKSIFSLMLPIPGAPVSDDEPSGQIDDHTPTLPWNNGTNAMWYQVWVGPASYSGTSYMGWHERGEVCNAEINYCSVNVPHSNALSSFVNYEFWARSWNTTGTSAWVKMSQFNIEGGIITD